MLKGQCSMEPTASAQMPSGKTDLEASSGAAWYAYRDGAAMDRALKTSGQNAGPISNSMPCQNAEPIASSRIGRKFPRESARDAWSNSSKAV